MRNIQKTLARKHGQRIRTRGGVVGGVAFLDKNKQVPAARGPRPNTFYKQQQSRNAKG